MSSRAVLDSSPVHIPHPPRPLKRSASTASLPTPPRTHHKKRTTRTHSSDEEDESDDHNHARPISKKPRTSAIAESPEGEDEEAFWLGGSSKPGPRTPTHSPSPPPPALLNYRNRKQNHSLASPPPSTSRNQHQQFVTPPRLERLAVGEDDGGSDGGRRMPVRDSPNNPFLANGSPGTPTPMPVNKNKEVDEKDGERPTLTYVFRGAKRVYANPLYNLPPSATARSLLPVEHPDFEPSEGCTPKLLFPKKGSKRNGAVRGRNGMHSSPTRGRGRGRGNHVDDSDDDAGADEGTGVKPAKLTFAEESIRRSPRLAARR